MLADKWSLLLNKNTTLNFTFKEITPKIVFKRGTTISNIFTSTRYKPYLDERDQKNINILTELIQNDTSIYNYNITQCKHPKCKCCSHIINLNYVQSINYHIQNDMNCNSTNLIYLITCIKCKKLYVGETKRKLKERLNHRPNEISFLEKDVC